MANCKECKEKRLEGIEKPATISLFEHESAMFRAERVIKRQWVAIILLIAMLFSCFALFVWYESQFDTYTYDYTQDGQGLNIIGNNNEVNDGTETESKVQEEAQE